MIQDKAYLDYIEKKESDKKQKEIYKLEIERDKKSVVSHKLAWAAIIISALSLLVSIIQVL